MATPIEPILILKQPEDDEQAGKGGSLMEQIVHTQEERSREKIMDLEEKDSRGSEPIESRPGEWEFNQHFSEVPYHQEPWWELMHYWINELIWRKKFWQTRR